MMKNKYKNFLLFVKKKNQRKKNVICINFLKKQTKMIAGGYLQGEWGESEVIEGRKKKVMKEKKKKSWCVRTNKSF